jgi:hypothetical protein
VPDTDPAVLVVASCGIAYLRSPTLMPRAGLVGRSTVGGGTVRRVRSRPRIDFELVIDGVSAGSETTCSWGGAHVLTVHTVIPRADLALELHSTFVGHPGLRTHVAHLRLGPPGCEPSLTSADIDDTEPEPTLAPRACAYEHAQRLIEVLSDLGHCVAVNVPGEMAFASLERIGPRAE